MSPGLASDKLVLMLQLSEKLSVPAASVRLRRVVCGVDGTSEAREAIRQAAELAAAGADLELVVVPAVSRGFSFQERAAAILDDADRHAVALGVSPVARALPAATAAAGLIRAAFDADLLVVGCDALGGTPKAVLRRARCALLLARRAPGRPLLHTVLVAADGPRQVHRWAAYLADVHGSDLRTAPTAEIAAVAESEGCGLIVIGEGASAAQVARAAPCSVLVIRDHG
jgi:nucleotide-binding universal stress UspA family protein